MATKKKLAKALRLFTAEIKPTGTRFLSQKDRVLYSTIHNHYRRAKRAYKRGQMSLQDVDIVNSLIRH